ncbi:hypothetical protein [Kutzneria sp. NPDC052558]|uniref:hypothetical protein n=1 Tax=Kutzneria sp. NPDC052558 TaxID=3364121 RepID=UPI0037CA4A8C
MGERFPELTWVPEGAGRWQGRLPVWPFDRPAPPGVDILTDNLGLGLELRYNHAYPAAVPAVFPVDPEPDIHSRTQHRWHLLGDGSLCLLAQPAQWTCRDSVVELLLKAAGWRIEYALMTSDAIESMTENGIVADPQHDELITEVARRG